jgi:hypothetical protein
MNHRQLNTFTVDHMHELLDGYLSSLQTNERLLAQTFAATKRADLLEAIRTDACDAGLLGYGLGMPLVEIRALFERSANAVLELFHKEVESQWKTPATLIQAVDLSLITQGKTKAVKLAGFGHYGPGDYRSGGFFADELIVAHIDAYCACVRDETDISIQLAQDGLTRAGARTAPFIRNLNDQLTALLTVQTRDGQRFSQALSDILDDHKKQATKGRLREDTHGLLSISALALARLALTIGTTFDISSAYLPLELLLPVQN